MEKRSDLQIYEQALKQRWPIEEKYKQAIVNRMMAIVINPQSKNREAAMASRILMAAEAQNQADKIADEKQAAIDEGRNRLYEIAKRIGLSQPDSSVSGNIADGDIRGDRKK